MEPLPRGSADPVGPQRPGPGPGPAPAPGTANPALPRAANVQKGKELYTTTCMVCHGETGQGGTHGGAPLTSKLTAESIGNVVAKGRNDMPAFGTAFSAESLQDLTAYVLQLVAHD
jgi:mono/diheme cytochrome c family protein